MATIATGDRRVLTSAPKGRAAPRASRHAELESAAFADVAQLVERELPKLEVAGSRPVVRLLQAGELQVAPERPPLAQQPAVRHRDVAHPALAHPDQARALAVGEEQAPPKRASPGIGPPKHLRRH